LRLYSEELSEEYPVGFDPHKDFAEMEKIEMWKMSLGLRFRYSMP
jgi:hypothetical protein